MSRTAKNDNSFQQEEINPKEMKDMSGGLYGNIVLSGGTTMAQGIQKPGQRFSELSDISRNFKDNIEINMSDGIAGRPRHKG